MGHDLIWSGAKKGRIMNRQRITSTKTGNANQTTMANDDGTSTGHEVDWDYIVFTALVIMPIILLGSVSVHRYHTNGNALMVIVVPMIMLASIASVIIGGILPADEQED